MIKPNKFEEVATNESFVPVAPGGHHMVIKQLKEAKSRSGKDMLVIAVDMAPNDSQPLYFSKMFEEDTRPEKKWPHAGTIYVVSVDANGLCSKNFKTFITSVEESNNFQVQWSNGPQWAAQFAGKRIGGVYGMVEEEYNGQVKKRCLHRWFCSDKRVESQKVPAEKLLNSYAASPAMSGNVPTGFTPVETEIPF